MNCKVFVYVGFVWSYSVAAVSIGGAILVISPLIKSKCEKQENNKKKRKKGEISTL
jgi:hypothetical protein